MRTYVILGSVASGKTTLARLLDKAITKRGYTSKYIGININHGFAYIITKILVLLTGYKYTSNYYLTLRFNNTELFCKYIGLMAVLDTLYAPIKLLTSIFVYKLYHKLTKREFSLIIDEYYFNAVIDYIYFTKKLCKACINRWKSLALRFFYKVTLTLALAALRDTQMIVVYLGTSLCQSIIGWVKREKMSICDISHLMFRTAGNKVIARNLDCLKHIIYNVTDPRNDMRNILRMLLETL
ncbi:MAG: hypothetical protein DRP01_02285 [Archaeoglobales archaeon]|nr:MAG: hypothetical protein DRP01_02285 [Archaeoglobales archaeon]